jgi:hypothetical protein
MVEIGFPDNRDASITFSSCLVVVRGVSGTEASLTDPVFFNIYPIP